MSAIVKIIKAEATAEKNATKRLVKITPISNGSRRHCRYSCQENIGVVCAARKLQEAGILSDRDQRNNLAAVLWIATEEGTKAFRQWAMNDDRACSTLRGIKKAAHTAQPVPLKHPKVATVKKPKR